MKNLIVTAALFIASATAASAQSEQALCHHSGLTYSVGSVITMGKSLQKCATTDIGPIWLPATNEDRNLESANCTYNGKDYGHGSMVDAVVSVLKCSNGIWFPPS